MEDGTPIIDMPEALNRAMGDVDFLKMMLEELHRTIPDYTSRIQQALQSKDFDTLGSDAHQFKGAAANLGAKAIAHAALLLEQIGKSGSLEGAQEAFHLLEQSIKSFDQHFKQIDWTTITPG
ncbi:MAG: Hpt domain-containing protein [Desulfobacteraceae bacterium]|jgi:HPt (histidine-containing phosphotransfer) domain-containing protein